MFDKFKEVVRNWVGPSPEEEAAVQNVTQSQQPHLSGISLEYKYEDLRNGTANFSQDRKLGSGAAGAVYRGVLRGGTEVAVKVLKDNGELAGFEDEIRMLSRFRHPNLVTLLGWGEHENEKYIVYELLPGGDVEKKLQKAKRGQQPFPFQHRLKIAEHAACGLSYMLNSEPKAFHRDIKPPNILLDANGNAKMADFGLAGTVKQKDIPGHSGQHLTVANIAGTPGYACQNYIATAKVSEKSEAYSFGTVLLELLMNEPPALQGPDGQIVYPLMRHVQPAAPGAHQRVMGKLDATAGWPPPMADNLTRLALRCVHPRDHERPAFESMVHELRLMNEAIGPPLPPTAQPPMQRSPSWTPAPPQMHHQGSGYHGSMGQSQPPIQRSSNPQASQVSQASQAQRQRSGFHDGVGQASTPPKPYQQGSGFYGASRDINPGHGGHQQNSFQSSNAEAQELAEIVLECTFAEGIEITNLPSKQRALAYHIASGSGSIAYGRQQQPDFFERLVPRPERLTAISRAHFELQWDSSRGSSVMLKKLSGNPLLLNRQPLSANETVIMRNGGCLSFTGTAPGDTIFLELRLSLRSRELVVREGVHPGATSPPPRKSSSASVGQSFSQPQQSFSQPQQPPKETGSSSRYILECTKSIGLDNLFALPEAERVIELRLDEKLELGKVPQPGFFERLLQQVDGKPNPKAEHNWLSFISRTHCRLQLSSTSVNAVALTVENLSANVISVGGQKLSQNKNVVIQEGDSIEFLAAPKPPDEVSFLVFKLRRIRR